MDSAKQDDGKEEAHRRDTLALLNLICRAVSEPHAQIRVSYEVGPKTTLFVIVSDLPGLIIGHRGSVIEGIRKVIETVGDRGKMRYRIESVFHVSEF